MARQKFDDIPMIESEKPITSPHINIKSTASGNNTEFIGYNPAINSPFIDESLDDEFSKLQILKNSQLDLSDAKALRYLAGTKTSVVYFNQVEPKVNNDVITVTSPNDVNSTKYNRIDNMIINIDGELNSSFEIDEGLAKNELTSSALIYPGVHPYPGDLFYMNELMNRGILYKVTSVEPITSLSNGGFKIEFVKHYEQFDLDQMTNLVAGYFIFNFEAVGTGENVVIEKTLYNVYRKNNELLKVLTEEYLHRFYDLTTNIICLNIEYDEKTMSRRMIKSYTNRVDYAVVNKAIVDFENLLKHHEQVNTYNVKIVDPFITKLFQQINVRNNVLYKGYAIYPVSPFELSKMFEDKFRYTVYHAIIHHRPDRIKFKDSIQVKFNNRTLRQLPYKNYFCMDYICDKDNIPKDIMDIDIFAPNFIDKVISNIEYSKEDDPLDLLKYNLIIKFINKKNYIPTIEELENVINSIDDIPLQEFFGMGSLLIYICAYVNDMILKKTY